MCTTATTATTAEAREDRADYTTLAEASRILGLHPSSVKNLALAGSIRTRWIPGDRIRYSLSDAQRLAESDSAA